MSGMTRKIGTSLIASQLKKKFRSVEWQGELCHPPADTPLIVYANHHIFDDSYVLSHFIERQLHRPAFIWMEQLDRFPFFRALGALPFPKDAPETRMRTIRTTARQFRRDPRSVLIYYPEGELHPGRNGVADFPTDVFARLDRVMPRKLWWPIVLEVTGWHRAHPTIVLRGGSWHETSHGHERETLNELLMQGRRVNGGGAGTRILDGRRGPDERWDFSRFTRQSAR